MMFKELKEKRRSCHHNDSVKKIKIPTTINIVFWRGVCSGRQSSIHGFSLFAWSLGNKPQREARTERSYHYTSRG
jgi:hypothetical protein